MTNNDPRVAGTAQYTWNADQWGNLATSTNGSMMQWGTVHLENAGGAWDSHYTGVFTGRTGDIFIHMFVGSGGYSGLSYYMWTYQTFGKTSPTQGLIFPGTPPTP